MPAQIMNRFKGVDFYVIDKFPTDLRPFYTMADPSDPAVSNAFDVFIRGEEVTSSTGQPRSAASDRKTTVCSTTSCWLLRSRSA